MPSKIVQLQDKDGNAVFPVAGGIAPSSVTTSAIVDGAITNDKLNLSYSTSEYATGERWIDGSPIYRKTINFGALPNAGSKSVAHGISGLSRVVLMTGYTRQPSSGRTRPLPPMTRSANDLLDIFTEGANVTIITNNDWSPYTETYINLYYTKSS